jgi:hypothetical protein
MADIPELKYKRIDLYSKELPYLSSSILFYISYLK